jgi:hypothetical protein
MGVPVTRSGRPTRPALLALVAGATVLAAGCGSQVATTSSATQPASPARTSTAGGGTLCAKPATVTRLLVSRADALPQNHLHFAFPARVTVSSPAWARAAAEAVCGLPRTPRTPMSCPADMGLSYRLSFATGTRRFPVVTAAAGGCGTVTGAGPARWTARSPGFWTVLAHAMGISTAAALHGTRPAGPHTSPARPHTRPARPGIVPLG